MNQLGADTRCGMRAYQGSICDPSAAERLTDTPTFRFPPSRRWELGFPSRQSVPENWPASDPASWHMLLDGKEYRAQEEETPA